MKTFLKDFLIASKDNLFKTRCQKVASTLKQNFLAVENLDELDIDIEYNYALCVVDIRGLKQNEMAGMCQIAKQFLPESNIIVVVDNRLPVETIRFIYQSGANLILDENEFFNHIKLEFYSHYIFNYDWVPVKNYDFVGDTEIDCFVYHLFPDKNKFIPVVCDGTITKVKTEKMQIVNEFYIKREDVSIFKNYVLNNKSTSQKAVNSKCRSQYVEFFHNYIQLSLSLTDNSKVYSFKEGKDLLDKLRNMCQELLFNVSCVEDPWMVVDNLCQKESFSLFRKPAVAIYTGICASLTELCEPEDAMIACLISDLGLLTCNTNLMENIPDKANDEIIKNHPNISINSVLERKLQIDEKMRKVIQMSHENPKGTGFPKKIASDNQPVASQLMQICEMLDKKLMIKPGQERPVLAEEKKKLLLELSDFSPKIVDALTKIWT